MQKFTLGDMPLGAPPWIFFILLFFIFWLHLISVWSLIGTLILGIQGLFQDKENWTKSRALSHLPVIFAFTLNLGVPPLLFVQILYAPFFFSSSILLAVLWFSVFFLLLLAYGMVYMARYGAKTRNQAIIYLSVSIVSVLIISYIYSNNMSLMIKPEYWQQLYSVKQNGFNLYPNIMEVTARWSWILIPALLTGAIFLEKPTKIWALVTGLIGIISLLIYKSFWTTDIASDSLVNVSFIIDLVLSVILLGLAFIPNKFVLMGWIGLKAMSAIALRHGIRVASLAGVYDLADIPIRLQPFLIGLFIIVTLVTLSVIFWMYKKGRKELAI